MAALPGSGERIRAALPNPVGGSRRRGPDPVRGSGEIAHLAAVRKNREDAGDRAVWPHGLSDLIASRGAEQARAVRAAVAALATHAPAIHAAHQARLLELVSRAAPDADPAPAPHTRDPLPTSHWHGRRRSARYRVLPSGGGQARRQLGSPCTAAVAECATMTGTNIGFTCLVVAALTASGCRAHGATISSPQPTLRIFERVVDDVCLRLSGTKGIAGRALSALWYALPEPEVRRQAAGLVDWLAHEEDGSRERRIRIADRQWAVAIASQDDEVALPASLFERDEGGFWRWLAVERRFRVRPSAALCVGESSVVPVPISLGEALGGGERELGAADWSPALPAASALVRVSCRAASEPVLLLHTNEMGPAGDDFFVGEIIYLHLHQRDDGYFRVVVRADAYDRIGARDFIRRYCEGPPDPLLSQASVDEEETR